MTIEEEARQFAVFKHGVKENEFVYAVRNLSYDGFKTGAEWMIEKAVEWFRNQKEEIGISWFDDYEIRFRKAMEE